MGNTGPQDQVVITGTSSADILSQLKAKAITGDGQIVFLVAKTTVGDNLGGFYRWDSSATGSEDTVFMNTIPSDNSTTGRWIRIFQKARTYPQGVFTNTGGVKNIYMSGTTNSSGQIVSYLTDDGTLSGNPLFTEVWLVLAEQSPSVTSGSSPILGYGIVSSDLKTLTCYFSQGASTTLAGTLLGIAGSIIPGLKPVAAGVPVQIKVEGI